MFKYPFLLVYCDPSDLQFINVDDGTHLVARDVIKDKANRSLNRNDFTVIIYLVYMYLFLYFIFIVLCLYFQSM